MNWWQLIWLRQNIFPSVPLRLVNPSKMFLEFFLVCWVNPELPLLSLKINYSMERINKKFFSGQELLVFHKKMSYWLIMRWSILMMCSKGTTVRSFLGRSRQILSCSLVFLCRSWVPLQFTNHCTFAESRNCNFLEFAATTFGVRPPLSMWWIAFFIGSLII